MGDSADKFLGSPLSSLGGEREDNRRWPPWLRPLLQTSFFSQCTPHAESHKSECNMFCLECRNGAVCSLCVIAQHGDHRVIQIRRSSYHDVVRVSEIHKILDISEVQTYSINSARVVFLNERPQQRPGKGVTNICEVCERTLLDSFRFCSLGCKVVGVSDDAVDIKGKRDSENKAAMAQNAVEYCSGTSEKSTVVQRFTPSTPPSTSLSYRAAKKRRKGVPHRAPFGGLIIEY